METIAKRMHKVDENFLYLTSETPLEAYKIMRDYDLDAIPVMEIPGKLTKDNVITFINWPNLVRFSEKYEKSPINRMPKDYYYDQYKFIQKDRTIFDAGLELEGRYALICLDGNNISGIINAYDLSKYVIDKTHVAREKIFEIESRLKYKLKECTHNDNVFEMSIGEMNVAFSRSSGASRKLYDKNKRIFEDLRVLRNHLMHPADIDKGVLKDMSSKVDKLFDEFNALL